MRPRLFVHLAIVLLALLTLLFLISRLIPFIQIFFEHSGISITQNEIADAHAAKTPDPRPQVIPKIIHQVFHDWRNQSMPADWDELRQTCINLNPDWEYRLWTEKTSRDFIETHYHWFLSTYDGYKFPVQRVDTARYFILLYYGGIYLDLDNGCLKNLEPLLYYPAWTTDGGRGALSNNILGTIPNHPFWTLLTQSLIPYNYKYIFPYMTISYASGQWFETAIWQTYHSLPQVKNPGPGQENRLYRIMMDDRPGTEPWIFFTQARGGSWVNWDNLMFMWIGDHLFLFLFGLCGLIVLLLWVMIRCARRWSTRSNNREGYVELADRRVKREDEDV